MAPAASRRPSVPVAARPSPLTMPCSTSMPDPPPISALFLIDFDIKAGYTIVWKQALPDLELEGVVEFKSLPSGLHTVPEDLIYFVHDAGHAGLSAFVNAPTEEEATRRARMMAVGVLVPLSYGRLGRAWRHAQGLTAMARKLSADRGTNDLLQVYWEANKAQGNAGPQPLKDTEATPLTSPAVASKNDGLPESSARSHARNRSASDGGALLPPGHRLSPYHPAWSLTTLLDTFGPLLFPIQRAALLRKRILITTHAPVREVCNFVYDISVLSNIPLSVFHLIDASASVQRLRPLFSIGVHDIPALLEYGVASARRNAADENDDVTMTEDMGTGWVACTTDSILAVKQDLFDILVTLPPASSSHAANRVWPKIECPEGVPVKATQRDLRRFRSLKQGLARMAACSHWDPTSTGRPCTDATESSKSTALADLDADAIVEPTTWSALAYNGFMWWASAGEQRRADEAEEAAHNAALLADLAPPSTRPAASREAFQPPQPNRGMSTGLAGSAPSLTAVGAETTPLSGWGGPGSDGQARLELAIIAYFHRLTTSILTVLADIVDNTDEDDDTEDAARLRRRSRTDRDDDGAASWIRVDSDALSQMGLDVWSRSDAEFVREVAGMYFARRAHVEMKGSEVCGLRVC